MRNPDILATIDAVVKRYELQKIRFNRVGNKAVLIDALQKAVQQAKVNIATLTIYTPVHLFTNCLLPSGYNCRCCKWCSQFSGK